MQTRQRARRRTGPPSTATVSRWSASDVDASRFDWLDGAKQQQTQVLVDALFAAEAVPAQRLPVLLALLEGRPDLEQALAAAGLPAAAGAVLRSDLLQRLLPGGLLLETLMGLIEDRAGELPADQLLLASRLVAVWHAPTGCEALGPASASLATAIADAVLDSTDVEGEADGAGSSGSGSSSSSSNRGGADTAATTGMLADALTLLQPWLAWRASGGSSAAAAAGASAASAAALGLLDAGAAAAEEAAEAADALAAARGAAEALLRRPEVAAATDANVLRAVAAAAAAYDVEVPGDLARTAASLASSASSSSSATPGAGSSTGAGTTAAELAAQLVAASVAGAAAGAGGGSGRGRGRSQLSGEELESVVWARLASELGAAEHVVFLRELLSKVRQMAPGVGLLHLGQQQQQQQQQQVGAKTGQAGPASEQQAARRALVVALSSAAGGLGPEALALALECAAAVHPAADADTSTASGGADALAATAVDELLSHTADAAAAVASRSADQVCRLAAAALALRSRAGSSANEAVVARVLAAAEAAQLQTASVSAVAALVAAAAAPGGGMALPPALVDALLAQLTQAVPASAGVDAATADLTPQQASALLEVAVAAAEEAAQAAAAAAPSSSTAAEPTEPAPIPPQRAAVLCAAADIAMRLLAPSIRRLDSASDVTRLMMLVHRCQRAGLRPREQRGLLWAAHERLRVLGLSMTPAEAVDVLRACAALRWAPSVLFAELLLPLVRQLQASAAAAAAAAGSGGGAAAAAAAPGSGPGGEDDTSALGSWGAAGALAASRPWTLVEVRSALALLAAVGYDGPMAASLVKLGVGELLRAHHAAATAARGGGGSSSTSGGGSSGAEGEAAQLGAEDMAQLLWVCVSLRYRGAAVLRPLLQLLLQVPAPQVSVRAAAQAVWAAARLGVVGERLVRWALAACQGQGKLAAAPPQSLANLCWGLGKLGVKPPRAFVSAVAAASLGQLPRFKPQELATTAFVLATWGGRLGAPAAGLVRHLVATRAHFDGPALCVAAWAMQRLAAAPPPPAAASPDATPGGGEAAGTTSGLDAGSLALLEQRLLQAVQEAAAGRGSSRPGGGDFLQSLAGVGDHHLLRFFSAAAAAGYRPAALLDAYCDALLPRLQRFHGCSPAAAAGAARRARLLWSAARVLQTFRVTAAERPELLAALEHAAEQCQAILGPQALAGVLGAMSDLGHYPAGWAGRGLLRCVRQGLAEADATEAAAIVAALAEWRERLEEGEAAAAAAAAAAGVGQEAGRQGNGLAAAGEDGAGTSSRAARAAKPASAKQAVSRRLDLLRQVAMARLTQLCVPAAAPAAAGATAVAAAVAAPTQAPGNGTAASTSFASTSSVDQAGAAPPSSAAAEASPSPGAVAQQPAIEPKVALSLLRSLARLHWHSDPLEGALVRAAAALAADPAGRRRVPALTTLLWAMASLRQDVPELLDELQAALMGLPRNTRSLAEEVAMLESGRLAGALGADSHRPPAPQPPAPAPAPAAQPVQQPLQQSAPVAPQVPQVLQAQQEQVQAAEEAAQAAEASAQRAVTAQQAAAAQSRPSPAAASPGTPPSSATTTTSGSSNNNSSGLLARPNKPATPAPAASESASPTASLSSLSSMDVGAAGAAGFDPAAATAAAAAALNQRLEAQLGGAAGRGRLASEPWKPVDVFKALWACAKMNRHPGPQILAAAERSWALATSAGGGGAPPPLHTVTGLLWSLSVFRHHNSAFAQQLAAQLAARLGALAAAASADSGEAAGAAAAAAALEKQAPQLAACLLAAAADRTDSPLNSALTPEARGRLLNAWRARQAERVAKPPGRYQTDLVSVLRKMGYTVAANVATPDGVAVADVAVAVTPNAGLRAASTATGGSTSAASPTASTASMDGGEGAAGAAGAGADGVAAATPPPPPRLLALELVGRHNSAANSPRIMGEAVIKYRLLQAHGYLVVPVSCYEWDRISHQDVWTKMVYLQAKIDRRTGTGLAASSVSAAAAAPAPPAGEEAVSVSSGASRLSQQQQQQ
ncbi:hypothetical protein HYH02_011772 [Chlamydomonas schloesseri]|uniref:RAP domain-containing protein n=1 Tax=Chlamydomonas schloesseri TaxID=2026947 RepID=A0A835VZX5_9CHLO|nr:hypothetical protein HYH02_011772 [Chlamydomonas schloesseri]|eukprot:KAG2435477.1 hypothetical protein HYH02_011772 [Chlamydomonas schloesseri]